MATNSKQSTTLFNRIALVGVSFAIGLIIGILAIVAFQNLVPGDEQSNQDIARSEVGQSSTNSANRISTTDRIEIGRFNEIFKHDSMSEQYSALQSTLSQANERELKEWWNQSKSIERASQRKIAQQVILWNLTAINPQEALRLLDDASLFQIEEQLMTIFNEWAASNLEGAIEAATTLEGSRRIVALQAILESRDDLSESKLRSIAIQLKGEETFLKLVSDSKVSESIETPEDSWNILLNDEVDDSLQTETLAIVAETWYEQVGFEVLSKIYAEVDDYSNKVYLLNKIVRINPAGAFEYAYGLDSQYDKLNLSTIVVRDWAKADAQAAMLAVSSLETSSFSSSLEDTIATTWARTTPSNLIENIDAIPEQFRLSTLETAFATIARRDPMEALTTMSAVASFVGNTSSILKKIVTEWSYQKPGAAAGWVVNHFTQDDSQRRQLLMHVLPLLARQDPEQAFELAKTNTSTTQEGVGLDHLVIRELALAGKIEEAKQLLPQVTENSKAAVYGTVGELMVRESEELDALELGKTLSEQHQSFYYVRVLSLWAATKPKNLYESLKDLPTKDLESQAALHLILVNRRQPVLSDDQIDHAKTLLSSADEKHLNRIVNPN